jgi:RNase P subunit RPR2
MSEQAAACPHCGAQRLYTRSRVTANSTEGIDLLPGLDSGWLFATRAAAFRVVVCADCGLTQFFANKTARDNLPSAAEWLPVQEYFRRRQEKQQGDAVEDTCLQCGKPLPADASSCAHCGWSYSSSEPA